MALHLLPKQKRKLNRKRWSFRLGSLTTITAGCVFAWNLMPEVWHPQFSETVKYCILGVVFLFSILSTSAHIFSQKIPDDNSSPTPAKTNAGMSTQ